MLNNKNKSEKHKMTTVTTKIVKSTHTQNEMQLAWRMTSSFSLLKIALPCIFYKPERLKLLMLTKWGKDETKETLSVDG